MSRLEMAVPCRCGHPRGNHGYDPPVCLTLPQCLCAWYVPDGESRATEASNGGEPAGASVACEPCRDTGVIEYEDPVIGGLVLASCPDCEGVRRG